MDSVDNVQSEDFDGADMEEAIKKAVNRFGVSREDLVIKIISEEQKGLFGMKGAKPAKIKAYPKKHKK